MACNTGSIPVARSPLSEHSRQPSPPPSLSFASVSCRSRGRVVANFVASLALLLFARTVHADPAPFVWASTCAIDWGTTYYGVTQHGPQGLVAGQHYVKEENPTVNWLSDRPALMVGLGAGIDVATWALLRHVQPQHPKLVKGLYYGMAAYRGFLVARTLQNISRADVPIGIRLSGR